MNRITCDESVLFLRKNIARFLDGETTCKTEIIQGKRMQRMRKIIKPSEMDDRGEWRAWERQNQAGSEGRRTEQRATSRAAANGRRQVAEI